MTSRWTVPLPSGTFAPVSDWKDYQKEHPGSLDCFQVKYSDGQIFDAFWEVGGSGHGFSVRDPNFGYWVRPTERFFKSLLPFGPVPTDWKEPRLETWREAKLKKSRKKTAK